MLKNIFARFNQKPSVRGLHIVATENAVVLYNNGTTIPITPDLADQLSKVLPRYAEISRALAHKPAAEMPS